MKNTKSLPEYIKLEPGIRPQDNLYGHVCHFWQQAHPLDDQQKSRTQFTEIKARIKKDVQTIIKSYSTDTNPSTDHAKVAHLYQTYCQKDHHSQKSLASLLEIRAKFMAVSGERALPKLLALANLYGLPGFFELDINIDIQNSQSYALFVDPSHGGLANRDYYLSPRRISKQIRNVYLTFLGDYQKRLQQVGFFYDISPAEILETETRLAKFTYPLRRAVNFRRTYNPFCWEKFNEEFDLPWSTYFQFAEITPPTRLIVSQPVYLKETLSYLNDLSPDLLKQYLLYQLALEYGTFLSEEIYEIKFNFFNGILKNDAAKQSLTTRGFDYVNDACCDIIGQSYVQRFLPVERQNNVRHLTESIKKAFGDRLNHNTWLSPAGKKAALAKLDRIIINVGFSNFWANYKDLQVDSDNPLQNNLHLHANRRKHYLALLAKTPNRQAFGIIEANIQNADAWSNLFLLNTNYPAGFLRPPFYDPSASPAYNLGALGSIIGHELTHHFDQTGAAINAAGSLDFWLPKDSRKAFKKATAPLLKTADSHQVAPKVAMKGKQVIDELIADLGGLEIAVAAAKALYPPGNAQKAALRELFIAYAFCKASHSSLEAKTLSAKQDVHPDAVFRVNGVVAHCKAFYEAFNVSPNDQLYLKPSARAVIW